MKKLATTIRCVPRYGYSHTDVRTLDLDLPPGTDEEDVEIALTEWFAHIGVADAVYGVEHDPNGYLAIINDEAYDEPWGEPLL